MKRALAMAVICAFFTLMLNPAYAEVKTVELGQPSYSNEESIKFVGTNKKDNTSVVVMIRDSAGKFVAGLDDPFPDSDGTFETSSKKVKDAFTTPGIYNATVFANNQKEADGTVIRLQYDGDKVFPMPDFILKLEKIRFKAADEHVTLEFTVQLTKDSVDGATFSLDGEPAGAAIDSKTGKFTWTPTGKQGSIKGTSYSFDIIVSKGTVQDTRQAKVTVFEAEPKPAIPKMILEPIAQPAAAQEDKAAEPEIIQADELGVATFVDESKDPFHYINRYNNEPAYQKWFDENYPEYDSIYEAVGLKGVADFVESDKIPQYYIDRYDKEPAYKKWFDENYPEYDSIYEAVGAKEPGTSNVPDESNKPIFGECGIGTSLVDDHCEIDKKPGGCLIATAAYGSELAPQVQMLREIRDNTLLSTESGATFMSGFSDVYYTFSPGIADLERQNPAFREAVRLFITPMLATLSIMTLAEEGSESQVLALGISVIALNLGMYIAAPALAGMKIRDHIRKTKHPL